MIEKDLETDSLKKHLNNDVKPHDISSLDLEKRINENVEPDDFPPSMEVLDRQDRKSNIKLKKGICSWVKWVVSLYLIVIGCILIIALFGVGKLSDNVMIALLTTTTINILGLPLMIIKSLFPKD